MWAEGRESSDLQLKPSLTGPDSLHRAIPWSGVATLSLVHRALWHLWVKVSLLCHFKNTVEALKWSVLDSAIGDRSCPHLKPQSFLWISCLDDSRIWNWYWKMKTKFFPDLHTESLCGPRRKRCCWCTKGSALIVFQVLCWAAASRAFPSETARQSLHGTGVQALLSSPEL